jgi:hypothetical protein
VNLDAYDYLLRVDADVVLAPNWLETHLVGEPDLCGPSGCVQLFKVAAFKQVLNGMFPRESDDSLVVNRYGMKGKKVVRAKDGFQFTVKPHRTVNYYLDRGTSMYRIGYEPLHVLLSVFWGLGNVFAWFTYAVACLRRPCKFDVAGYVRAKQLARLRRLHH